VHVGDPIRLRPAGVVGTGFTAPAFVLAPSTAEGRPAGGDGDEGRQECVVLGALSSGGSDEGAAEAGIWTIHAGDEHPPHRVGMEVPFVRQLANRVAWHGRGPQESYPDRYAGARLGLWEGAVSEQTFRYVRPQETGNKLDSRWMALSDQENASGTLVVACEAPLSMSCHHFTADDLDSYPDSRRPRVRHAAELVERDLTNVSVDGAHAGVGGIDSWGSIPLPQHRLDAEQPCKFVFALVPFAPHDDSVPGTPLAQRGAEIAATVRGQSS